MSDQLFTDPESSARLPFIDLQAQRLDEISRCLEELHSTNPYLRSNSVRRLGDLHAASDSLIQALKNDPNSYVRSASAEALGHFPGDPSPEIIEELLAAIDDSNDYVCSAVINSLGLLHAKSAVEQVKVCLEDSNPVIVQAAILALARMAPAGIAIELEPFLDSPQYLIHLSTVRAIGYLDYTPAGPKIHAFLENHLNKGNAHDLKLSKVYIEVLARLKVRSAIPQLIEIARHEVGLRSAAVEALIDLDAEEAAPILALLLTDPSNRLRRNLIEMMMKADYRPALPLIRALLRDSSIAIRETALAAVARWKDIASIETVRWMAYSDPNPFVRPQAVTALSNILDEEALPDLLALANDLNGHVRRSVVYSLGRLNSLPEDAVTLLNQLPSDPDLACPVQDALVAHQLTPGALPFPPTKQTCSMLPYVLRDDAPFLLDSLERWQTALITQPDIPSLEQMAYIDQALTTLIKILKKPNLI
ncbi:MAG TPA: HEAT repeat domain-containing protein [Anaerolineaceae bacterium]